MRRPWTVVLVSILSAIAVAGYAAGDVLMPRCVLEKSGGWEVTLR